MGGGGAASWTDIDDQDRTVAYPAGVTGLDQLASTFPADQRSCFTRDPNANPSYRTTPCDEPHSGQYLLVLDGLPPGRQPVSTWVVRPREGARVLARVKQALAQGEQAFVVYPLVEGNVTVRGCT